MKRWRKIVIFTLILVMPISLWASVSMTSHCPSSDNTSHSMHMQMDNNSHKHKHDSMSSQDINVHSNCECGCDGDQDCSVAGCSASALSNSIAFELTYFTQTIFQQAQALIKPSEPNLLFRPPIALS